MHYNTTCFRRHQNVRCRSAVWQSRKGLGTLWRAHEHQVIPLAKMNESENRKMEGKEGKFFLGIGEWGALSCPNLKCVYTQVLIHTLLRHLYCLFDFTRGNLDYVTFFVVERRNILIFLINCCDPSVVPRVSWFQSTYPPTKNILFMISWVPVGAHKCNSREGSLHSSKLFPPFPP